MLIFRKILIWLKSGGLDGNIDGEFIKDNKSDNFVDELINLKKNDQSKITIEDRNIEFFEKIRFLNLSNIKKNEIAKNIVDDSYVDKLYWIQFSLACMIATSGLLMNSIPVVIGAMLISPLINPIKTFAFAIANGNRGMYIRSIKTLLISMFVAIVASMFISFIIPFATLTTEIMARTSPTIVDLFVALFSGAVAFLSLGFKKLEENVAGVAMSLSLLPPLSVIGIGLYFMDFSVAQGSFLLFMANLVAILIIGVVMFYMFGFFPTNKEGQKRSFLIGIMVLLSVLIVSIPLQKSMFQISSNMKITNNITMTSKSYINSLNTNIVLDKISFKNISDDLLRVSTVINVPNNFIVTNEHKNELTKLLSMATQKSVELDLDIVEISSVYFGDKKSNQDILIDNIRKIINNDFKSIFIIDHRLLEQDNFVVFLNLYTDKIVDKEIIYDVLFDEVKYVYGTGAKLAIQWQGNEGKTNKIKSEEELAIQSQFYAMFPDSNLNNLTIDSLTKKLSGENHEYVYLDIDFTTPKSSLKTKNLLKGWKTVLEVYFDADVIINSKIEYFSQFEL